MTLSDKKTYDLPNDHVLFQEWLKDDPFWMLVACQLVNLTTWKAAKPVFEAIKVRYSIPELAVAPMEDIECLLKPLGLYRRRARSLTIMAHQWLSMSYRPVTRQDVLKLCGCGKYASDSWAIFIEKDYLVQPNDGALNWYLERRNR